MAAKRPRDHAAETRRRNELAASRGHRNRYEQRRKIETGKLRALQPERIRSRTTYRAQEKLLADAPRPTSSAYADALFKISDEQRARDWSTLFARSDVAKYKPEDAKALGLTKRQYTSAYLKAFTLGDARYSQTRHNKKGATSHLHYWLVDLQEYFTDNEYESRYGPAV